ncbi:hypothetical protein Moror_7275 [Moniliophthora roreri MCA 2997]|uniref:Guanine nucleotide exchange factor synembryn n=2 Tax=Moniliophthora roreri TaxID=221103 RepID=V2YWS5_MONRO|nr:hypothetical protein Moror_7275 [Moniliophthora roreri MCA 2997]KAI3621759.1 hypothetical protein WG66_015931 [Moniliophthora roreri]
MSDLLVSYTALSPSSSRSEVSKILTLIINALPWTVNNSTRAKLIEVLLNDLKKRGPESRLTNQDAAKGLLAVKTLGKKPEGAEQLATAFGFSTLLALAVELKDDVEASSEALRCIANTLLLFDQSRTLFITEEVGGGEICVKALNECTHPDQIFVLARILFFATVTPSPFVVSLVEKEHEGQNISDIIGSKLDLMLVELPKDVKMAKEAIADLLKLTFNILLHYPKLVECEPQSSSASEDSSKIMGDFWSSKLNGFILPLLRVYQGLPVSKPTPLVSPLTNAIHCLITIPVNESVRDLWFGTDSNQAPDVVARTRDLIDECFALYFPKKKSPDDSSVRDYARSLHPDDELDDILSPLVMLLTRLCLGNASTRQRILDWTVPPDLDRDPERPLDERPTFLGRCLRLMGSVYHRRLKDAVGEMLYIMCGEDAGVLCSKVGYGHVAGFLFEKGVMSAPDTNGDDKGKGKEQENEDEEADNSEMTFANPETRQINPITGTYVPDKTSNPADDMSEEEKEREMEKLFVLFDRMEKTGALQPEQNPVRKAIQKSMQS